MKAHESLRAMMGLTRRIAFKMILAVAVEGAKKQVSGPIAGQQEILDDFRIVRDMPAPDSSRHRQCQTLISRKSKA